MNAMTPIAKAPRQAKAPSTASGASPPAPQPKIVPSAPRLVRLDQLRRAEENVRHTRYDEDIEGLAADIAAHGLLQSLIGYEHRALGRGDPQVMIVGGGRRFQALRILEDEGVIDGDWPVAVLIRDRDEAVELSLAENLQQRTMSPVDEFFAFKALMDTGHYSPASLAARFGFTERVVRQRLRLAQLEPEVLDALAQRRITLDAAMAYAATQDRELQRKVFTAHDKKGAYEPHAPARIRRDLAGRMDDKHQLYRYVGPDAYEAAGGGYEDDLFNEAGDKRLLDNPGLVEQLAHARIDGGAAELLEQLRARADLASTITGLVKIPDLMLHSWGTQAKLKPPAGFAEVKRYDHAKLWKTIRNNGLPVHVLLGVNPDGELKVHPEIVFVPLEQQAAIDKQSATPVRAETPEERAARERKAAVEKLQRRLAVGPFAGTPFEGRAFWPEYSYDKRDKRDGEPGWLVEVLIFASDAAIAAAKDAAEAQYDAEQAEGVRS